MLQSMRSAAKYIWILLIAFFIGGFLLVETSGLLGTGGVTTSSVVASINGEDIPYLTWAQTTQNLVQQRERQGGRSLTLDERRQVEEEAFDQMVGNILLAQEYEKRGIRVSDEEVVQMAQFSPPPEMMQSPELLTEGQFDLEKYQRLLKSPAARQQGLLVQLENYYRTEIPRAKLFDQIVSDVYVSDQKLWSAYRDASDSAQVRYVAFESSKVPDSAVTISDAEIRAFYESNKARFKRPGRAVLSLVSVPRVVTAADTAATRARISALRQEILGGAKFEDVATRESTDSISAAQGGSLGKGPKGRFVAEFESAAAALTPGQLSEPVLTQFGYHLIRLDGRTGDTLDLRHILLPVKQSDSSATRSDRRADSLANIAGASELPARFDSAAKLLKLTRQQVVAFEGTPLNDGTRAIPSVSAWAFGGPRVGESSELFDDENAYYLARIDSLQEGGDQPLDAVKTEIRGFLAQRKKSETLVPKAQALAKAAAAGTLENAAKAQSLSVATSPLFTRATFVGGLGRLNEAIGAAFTLPLGKVSAPIVTNDGVFVIQVDRRIEANRAEFEKQKETQRQSVIQGLRQQRVREFLNELRKKAKIEDNRKEINAQARVATATS